MNATHSRIGAPALAVVGPTEAAGASNRLTDLCAADSPLNLMGQSLESIRDDLAAKLVRYNEVRVRRGLAPITEIRPARHFGKQGVGA